MDSRLRGNDEHMMGPPDMNTLALKPTIRLAMPQDAAPLAALKLAAFRETFIDDFKVPYPPADLAIFERDSYCVETVARELADPTHATWIGDGLDGAMLGYAHVGPCKLPHPDVRAGEGELYQIYLLRAAQGMGLGSALLDTAFAHLATIRPGPIWIGVWSGNARARAVYAGKGFAEVGGYGFPVGEGWVDQEVIMRRG